VAKSLAFRRGEQVPVVLEQSTASRAVHYHRFGAGSERREIRLGKTNRTGVVAGMGVQGTAADLSFCLDYLITIRFECPASRRVNVGEQSVHDAAGEDADRAS